MEPISFSFIMLIVWVIGLYGLFKDHHWVWGIVGIIIAPIGVIYAIYMGIRRFGGNLSASIDSVAADVKASVEKERAAREAAKKPVDPAPPAPPAA